MQFYIQMTTEMAPKKVVAYKVHERRTMRHNRFSPFPPLLLIILWDLMGLVRLGTLNVPPLAESSVQNNLVTCSMPLIHFCNTFSKCITIRK